MLVIRIIFTAFYVKKSNYFKPTISDYFTKSSFYVVKHNYQLCIRKTKPYFCSIVQHRHENKFLKFKIESARPG